MHFKLSYYCYYYYYLISPHLREETSSNCHSHEQAHEQALNSSFKPYPSLCYVSTQTLVLVFSWNSRFCVLCCQALQAPACHENMVKVGGYILGEFGNLIAGDPRSRLENLSINICRMTSLRIVDNFLAVAYWILENIQGSIDPLFSCHTDCIYISQTWYRDATDSHKISWQGPFSQFHR